MILCKGTRGKEEKKKVKWPLRYTIVHKQKFPRARKCLQSCFYLDEVNQSSKGLVPRRGEASPPAVVSVCER